MRTALECVTNACQHECIRARMRSIVNAFAYERIHLHATDFADARILTCRAFHDIRFAYGSIRFWRLFERIHLIAHSIFYILHSTHDAYTDIQMHSPANF